MADYYYWLIAKDPETGKPYLIPGGRTESEAHQKGLEMLGGIDFKVKRLNTRDPNRASSLLKGERLEKTKSLKTATERLGRTKSLLRMRKRRGI